VGDLDPKFKYLIGGVVALLLMFIVVSNLYYAEPEIADLWYGLVARFFFCIGLTRCLVALDKETSSTTQPLAHARQRRLANRTSA